MDNQELPLQQKKIKNTIDRKFKSYNSELTISVSFQEEQQYGHQSPDTK
jgi:predicted transposase YdaD